MSRGGVGQYIILRREIATVGVLSSNEVEVSLIQGAVNTEGGGRTNFPMWVRERQVLREDLTEPEVPILIIPKGETTSKTEYYKTETQ